MDLESRFDADVRQRRRDVVIAGHRGDSDTARRALTDPAGSVRASALAALMRCGAARDDSDPEVRRRGCLAAAHRPPVSLMTVLDDPDPTVLETAAWACGEHEVVSDDVLERLITLAGDHDDALVREAAVAALGAIGDPRGLDAILAGCSDRPAVRRRAVLALAPFDGPDVDAALARALEDRDWQVRQAAEDLTSPTR
jgi:HEAT repeat protein